MELEVIHISPYIEAGNMISPEIIIPYEQGRIIGVYTDQAKSQYVLKMLMRNKQAYVHIKDDQLYENLTVREQIRFLLKIYHSKESVDTWLHQLQLDDKRNTRIKHVSRSTKQLLHFLKFYLCEQRVVVIEEPIQNLEEHTKRLMIQLLSTLTSKMLLLISNNMEDLLLASHQINRLDEKGLKVLDISNQEVGVQTNEHSTPIRFEKIPTKKNEKIILFNPPEIDYIESVEGEVLVHVAGEAFPCALTLAELEKRLLAFGFFRCHRSYIVNLQKVREIITWTKNSYSLSIETIDKAAVPLSKNKLSDLKELIGI